MKVAVKVLVLFFSLAAAAAGAASGPEEVAVDFLEKVRAGKVNLEPGGDTALSATTGPEKRRQIASRLKRLAQDLGSGPLEAGEVRLDVDHAAVLVYRVGGYDPSRVRAFPIALVRQDGEWHPAPVPASFENTGVGYPALLRKKILGMENWMLRQQVAGVESLRERLKERLKLEIRGRVNQDEIRALSPESVGRRFIEASSRRDLPAMLGFLGGLQGTLPDDWSERLSAAENAVAAGDQVKRPWRLLVMPEVVRTVVYEEVDGSDALISLGCLDPAGGGGQTLPWVEVVHLELSRGPEGMWRVDPPQAFLEEVEESEFFDEDLERNLDADLLDLFPRNLRHQLPAVPRSTVPEVVTAFSEGLRAGDLSPLLALLDLEGDPRIARLGCSRLARAWQLLRDPVTVRHAVPLGFHQAGSAAVVVFQYFSSREPDKVDLRSFFFRKGPGGWMLSAGLKPEGRELDEETAAVVAWDREKTSEWQQSWRGEMLKTSIRLAKVEGPAPSAGESRRVVEEWLAAVSKGDVAKALSLTAWLSDDRGGPQILRNLAYEVKAARANTEEPALLEVFSGDVWSAVGVRAGSPTEALYPLYPVVATPEGPRILIEVDLFASGRRRDFLNKEAVRRSRAFSTPEAAAELNATLEKFQSLIREPGE